MAFGCIFAPNFLVQAVMRSNADLQGHALAIISGTAPVWSVVGINEAAAKTGIALGMTKSQVQQFCGIEIRHRSETPEKAAHAALMDLAWSISPRVEDTAPDTVVIDLTGLNPLFGPDEKIAAQLAERALELGLRAHVAVASKIDTAIVAARGCAGVTVIPEGQEAEVLGSLPVGVLAPSEEVLETLDRWGVRTCGALAALPVLQLSERLGQEGVLLHELARAQRERSLVLAEPQINFEEEMGLEDAVEELEPLSFLLGRLLDQLCARLNARSLAACAVRVRFELDPGFEAEAPGFGAESNIHRSRSNRETFSAANTKNTGAPPAPQENKIAGSRLGEKPAPKIYERVLSLPVAMRNSKMLLNLLRLHLQSDPPQAPIMKIFLTAEAARSRVTQSGLFLPSSPDPEKLELTLARLANLVGDANVGSPELVDTHRPGEFRMRRFAFTPRLASTHSELQRSSGRSPSSSDDSQHFSALRSTRSFTSEINSQMKDRKDRDPRRAVAFARWDGKPVTAFRVFRPALRAKVDLNDGCPAQINFEGRHGRVLAASGPWRSSGDWWREDGWQHDEWDLEIEFGSAPGTRFSYAEKRISSVESRAETRANAVAGSNPLDQTENRHATNSATTANRQRGVYRVFYDAIHRMWFVRGACD